MSSEIERLTSERDALRAELERFRHGQEVEGDFVCPDSLALNEVRAELEKVNSGHCVKPDEWGTHCQMRFDFNHMCRNCQLGEACDRANNLRADLKTAKRLLVRASYRIVPEWTSIKTEIDTFLNPPAQAQERSSKCAGERKHPAETAVASQEYMAAVVAKLAPKLQAQEERPAAKMAAALREKARLEQEARETPRPPCETCGDVGRVFDWDQKEPDGTRALQITKACPVCTKCKTCGGTRWVDCGGGYGAQSTSLAKLPCPDCGVKP